MHFQYMCLKHNTSFLLHSSAKKANMEVTKWLNQNLLKV